MEITQIPQRSASGAFPTWHVCLVKRKILNRLGEGRPHASAISARLQEGDIEH